MRCLVIETVTGDRTEAEEEKEEMEEGPRNGGETEAGRQR